MGRAECVRGGGDLEQFSVGALHEADGAFTEIVKDDGESGEPETRKNL